MRQVARPASAGGADETTAAAVEASVASNLITSPAELAELLWSTDFVGLILNELEQYAEISVSEFCHDSNPTKCLRLVHVF